MTKIEEDEVGADYVDTTKQALQRECTPKSPHSATKPLLANVLDLETSAEVRTRKAGRRVAAMATPRSGDVVERYEWDNGFDGLNESWPEPPGGAPADANDKTLNDARRSSCAACSPTLTVYQEMVWVLLSQILREMHFITLRMREDDETSSIVNDWKFVSAKCVFNAYSKRSKIKHFKHHASSMWILASILGCNGARSSQSHNVHKHSCNIHLCDHFFGAAWFRVVSRNYVTWITHGQLLRV